MSGPVTFTVQMSFDDYLAANKVLFSEAWTAKSIAFAWSKVTLLAAAPILLLSSLGSGARSLEGSLIFLIFIMILSAIAVGAYVFQQRLFLGRSAQEIYGQLKTVDLPTTYELTDDGIEVRHSASCAVHPWSEIMDFVETDELFMIRRSSDVRFGIPKAQLDQATQIKLIDLLRANGVRRG